MQHREGANGTWFHRRFGPGAWADMVPPQRLAWCLGGATGALLLLGAFYLVLHQSLARADQHWAQARGADGCAVGRTLASADRCAASTVDAVAARNGPAAARMVANPR